MSFTWGRRMKLAIPVNRAAFMASTGRYLGTAQLTLDGLEAFLVDDADDLVAERRELGAADHRERPRPRQIHPQRGADSARPVGHDVDHVPEEDRLFDVV